MNPSRNVARGGQRGNENAKKHGLFSHKSAHKSALMQMDLRSIDRRTILGAELARRREQIFADVGGRDKVSEIKEDLIEKYLRTYVFIESIDLYLFQQSSLVNRRTKALHPIIRERAALVDSALRLTQAIGLEHESIPEVDLKTYLSQKSQTRAGR